MSERPRFITGTLVDKPFIVDTNTGNVRVIKPTQEHPRPTQPIRPEPKPESQKKHIKRDGK